MRRAWCGIICRNIHILRYVHVFVCVFVCMGVQWNKRMGSGGARCTCSKKIQFACHFALALVMATCNYSILKIVLWSAPDKISIFFRLEVLLFEQTHYLYFWRRWMSYWESRNISLQDLSKSKALIGVEILHCSQNNQSSVNRYEWITTGRWDLADIFVSSRSHSLRKFSQPPLPQKTTFSQEDMLTSR